MQACIEVSRCWPQPRVVALVERDHYVGRRLRPSVQPGLGEADRHGRAVAVALQREQPARRLQREVRRRAVRVRARLSVGRDRGVDQRRVDRVQLLVAQPERGQRARFERLEQRVRAARQLAQARAVGRAVEVEHDAELTDGVGGPVQRAVELARGATRAVDERRVTPRGVPAGRFDLDHLGADVGQQPARDLAGRPGQVEHPHPVEGCRIRAAGRSVRHRGLRAPRRDGSAEPRAMLAAAVRPPQLCDTARKQRGRSGSGGRRHDGSSSASTSSVCSPGSGGRRLIAHGEPRNAYGAPG